jgi:hypothetical protein
MIASNHQALYTSALEVCVPKSFSMNVATAIAAANKINKTAVKRVEYRKLKNFFILLNCFLKE